MSAFSVIVITAPETVANEETAITALLESRAVDFVHIRKPDMDYADFKRLVERIPSSLHPRLKIHSHFRLLEEFCLGGAHVNSRSPAIPANSEATSRSCHSVEELRSEAGRFCYQTLSPVFDSISKQGYTAKFIPSELKGKLCGLNVIALGGVMPKHFLQLKDTGFSGAAMLGYVWQDVGRIRKTIEEISTHKLQCCNT